jgi:hypothetical protein
MSTQILIFLRADANREIETLAASSVDWSPASNGYIQAVVNNNTLSIPLASILYVQQ